MTTDSPRSSGLLTDVEAGPICPEKLGGWDFHGARDQSCRSTIARLSCSMVRSFKDGATEDLFFGRDTKAARKALPRELWRQAGKKLDALDSAATLADLRIPPGNRLEALKGDRSGQHSIRINDQYRICFLWTDTGPEDVGVVDYH